MRAKQNMTQANTQAAKAAIMAAKEAQNPVNIARTVQVMLRTDGPALQQPTFDAKAADRSQELWNFQIDIKNTFMTDSYNTQDNKKVSIDSTGLTEGDYNSCKH